MSKLYICEKPSLAKVVASNIGKPVTNKGYYQVGNDYVVWLKGHIIELQMPDDYCEEWKRSNNNYDVLPIIPDNFIKRVKTTLDYGAIYSTIKSLAKQVDTIVNVGDPDREGQYLVDEVVEMIGWNGNTERLFINAYDDTTVKRALAAIEDNNSAKNYNMFRSAFCRDISDWLIGMNGSRKFSLDAGRNIVIGRVQIPILSLIYRRNKEIDEFKPVKYYKVKADNRSGADMFNSEWKPSEAEKKRGFDSEDRLIDKSIAESVSVKVKGKSGKLIQIVKEHKKTGQPLPFSLATLQKTACSKLGISLKDLDNIMQALYEKHKLLTYPRSDCEYIPESQHTDASGIIEMLKGISDKDIAGIAAGADASIKSRAFNTKKTTAHHAIIPTSMVPDFGRLTNLEREVYLLAAERYLLQFYPVYEYDATKFIIECENEIFEANGSVVTEPGWKKVGQDDAADKDKDDSDKALPDLKEGDVVAFDDVKVIDSDTKPPARFTQESLITALCNAYKYVKNPEYREVVKNIKGLGTPATRSKIIDKLLERGTLIEKKNGKKKELYTSDDVAELVDFLPSELTYPDETALIELDLDKVASGEMTEAEYTKKISNFISELMKIKADFTKRPAAASGDHPACPKCKQGVLYLHDGKYGKFWSCSRYKEGCDAVFADNKGKPVIIECPECGGFLSQHNGKYGKYWSCSNYKTKDCKVIFDDISGKPGIFKCPACKNNYLRRMKSTRTDSYFWGCGGYKTGECKAVFPDVKGKPGKPPAEAECPLCGKPLRRVNTKNGLFWICSNKDNGCKAPWFADLNGKPDIIECPQCGNGFLTKRKGAKGDFYSCSNYPSCKAIYSCNSKGRPVFKKK